MRADAGSIIPDVSAVSTGALVPLLQACYNLVQVQAVLGGVPEWTIGAVSKTVVAF